MSQCETEQRNQVRPNESENLTYLLYCKVERLTESLILGAVTHPCSVVSNLEHASITPPAFGCRCTCSSFSNFTLKFSGYTRASRSLTTVRRFCIISSSIPIPPSWDSVFPIENCMYKTEFDVFISVRCIVSETTHVYLTTCRIFVRSPVMRCFLN